MRTIPPVMLKSSPKIWRGLGAELCIQDLKSNYDANSKGGSSKPDDLRKVREYRRKKTNRNRCGTSDNSLAINPTLEILKEIPPKS